MRAAASALALGLLLLVAAREVRGEVRSASFSSTALGREVAYVVDLPASYDAAGARKYPVVYALHGLFEGSGFWERRGLAAILAELRAGGGLPEFLVVAVDGGNSFFVNAPGGRYEDMLTRADEILVYMHLMLDRARAAGHPVTRKQLQQTGADPDFFDGLDHWFDRIDSFADDLGLQLDHYVVSSGIYEMIAGCPLFPRFRQVFASRFLYDKNGEAKWPSVAINYTTKTQFLFRINKGIDNVHDTEAINRWMHNDARMLPFERMIFIGDGDTDIPSMKMVTSQGGCAIAVLDPYQWTEPRSLDKISRLIAEDRVS